MGLKLNKVFYLIEVGNGIPCAIIRLNGELNVTTDSLLPYAVSEWVVLVGS